MVLRGGRTRASTSLIGMCVGWLRRERGTEDVGVGLSMEMLADEIAALIPSTKDIVEEPPSISGGEFSDGWHRRILNSRFP